MGRKRRQAGSKSGASSSDSSFNSAPGSTSKVPNKKQRTVECESDSVASASAKKSLSKFEFVSRDNNMADNTECESVHGDKANSDVFSPERDSGTVSNEDLMVKLCANGKDIAKLSDSVEYLRSQLLTLQLENESLRKEVSEAKDREDKLKSKLEEVKCTADLADRRSEELSVYMRRNNLRIFGIDEAGRDGKEETPEECEGRVLKLFRDKLKVKVERGDIEALHRLGTRKPQPQRRTPGSSPGSSTQQQQQQGAPRGIIVRFVSRRVRDSVLYARRLLRGTRALIVEDLTPRTYSLLCKVREDTAVCKQAWTKQGTVVMKTVSGNIVTVKSLADLKEHGSTKRL